VERGALCSEAEALPHRANHRTRREAKEPQNTRAK
jgi:hypothetical protein